MRFLILPAVAILIVTGVLAGVLQQSTAEAKCYPARVNDGKHWAVGEVQYAGYPTAMSSALTNYDPYVVLSVHPVTGTNWGQMSTAWVMLAGGSSPGYAQVGWVEYKQDWRYTFYEYSNPYPSYYRRLVSDSQNPYPEGQLTAYQVVRDDVIPGYFTFRAGPPRLDGNPAPAVGYGLIYFSPDHGEIAAEITSKANQLAGGRGGPYNQYFYADYIRSYTTWYNFNGIRVNNDPVEFSWLDIAPHPIYGGGAFATFDNRCAS